MISKGWVASKFVTVIVQDENGKTLGRTWVKVTNPQTTAVDILSDIDNKYTRK